MEEYIKFLKETLSLLLTIENRFDSQGEFPEVSQEKESAVLTGLFGTVDHLCCLLSSLTKKYLIVFYGHNAFDVYRPDGTRAEWFLLDTFHLPPDIEAQPYTFVLSEGLGGEQPSPELA